MWRVYRTVMEMVSDRVRATSPPLLRERGVTFDFFPPNILTGDHLTATTINRNTSFPKQKSRRASNSSGTSSSTRTVTLCTQRTPHVLLHGLDVKRGNKRRNESIS